MRTALLALMLLLLTGCGVTVRHQPAAFQPIGTALPVEVSHNFDNDAKVEGVVHYRVNPGSTFAQAAMQMRGGQLWTMLPTEDLARDECVEYYIDIDGDGKLYALGSPGRPFVTTFLDRTGMIIANLHATIHASDTNDDVVIVLHTKQAPVREPVVEYFMPDVPGVVRAPMDPNAYGDFVIVIPAHAVRAGTWRYALEMDVEGYAHRIPEQGFGAFDVRPAPEYHRPRHAEHSDSVSDVVDIVIEGKGG